MYKRQTKISFINEIADLCEKVDADVGDVARGIGTDSRIGARFLQPGPGYGGSCFPKDTLALLKTGENYGADLRIVQSVVDVNNARKKAMGAKVIAALENATGGGPAQGKTVALLGLTFKADTDDMRDSPAIDISAALQDAGITVRAYDPEGMETSKEVIDGLVYCADSYDAMAGADAAVIVTEWDAFRALDLGRAKKMLNTPLLVDLRNLYSRADVEKQGLTYVAVGR